MHGYFFAEVLGDFFQGQTSGFGEEEVDDCWMLVRCYHFVREEGDIPGMKKADQQMITR